MKKTKKCTNCLTLLGDNTRTKIIKQLKKKPSRVSDIEANFSLTQPTISYHLNILKKLGMVQSKKQGREVYYHLNEKYPCKKCDIFNLPFKT
ncbi:MAG: metalloregulator ArsR/SmtB family transcription factor [Candidatus Pacebacteria bacterium]|nr:metalloregulator ArsR/SmtB family transcription factor [Candidatus Paceibacterota bacterium]